MLMQYPRKLWNQFPDPLVGLDPLKIRGQGYDGTAVMSSNRAGVPRSRSLLLWLCTCIVIHTAFIYLLPLHANCRKLRFS